MLRWWSCLAAARLAVGVVHSGAAEAGEFLTRARRAALTSSSGTDSVPSMILGNRLDSGLATSPAGHIYGMQRIYRRPPQAAGTPGPNMSIDPYGIHLGPLYFRSTAHHHVGPSRATALAGDACCGAGDTSLSLALGWVALGLVSDHSAPGVACVHPLPIADRSRDHGPVLPDPPARPARYGQGGWASPAP